MVKDMASCSAFRFDQPYREDGGFRVLLGFRFSACIIHNLYASEFRDGSVRELFAVHLWWCPNLLLPQSENSRSEGSSLQKIVLAQLASWQFDDFQIFLFRVVMSLTIL